MQNPLEDTEWNDVLRAKGILPPKEQPHQHEPTLTQGQVESIVDLVLEEKLRACTEDPLARLQDAPLDELDLLLEEDELADDEEIRILESYR